MSEENNNFDAASQQEAAQAAEKLKAEQDQAIEKMNKEKAEQDAAEARRQQAIQQEANAYGEAARAQTKSDDDSNDGNMNFNAFPNNQVGVDFNGSAVNDDNFSFSPNNQTPDTYSSNDGEAQSYTYDRPNDDNSPATLATATPNLKDIQNISKTADMHIPFSNPTTADNQFTHTNPSTSDARRSVGTGTSNGGNNGLNANNLGATAGGQPQNKDELKGVYATEEMFSARFVPQPFYLSDRFKNTWKECMKGFNEAKDPGEMMEELFWGFANMAPKMIIAFSFHLEDQEIERKRAAQHDKEEYDQQLLLMKGLSPAEFHKHKCDWVFGSEELHKYLKEHQPDLPKDEHGYVDISKCDDQQKKQVREHVENFIKNEPYYKNMIENFTHREFAQDELNREAKGMAPATFRMQGKPNVVTRNGDPINMDATQPANGPQGPTNGPDNPTPTPPRGPDRPTPPTNGPDRPTPPNGPQGPAPRGPQGPAPRGPQGPNNPQRPDRPTPPKTNIGLETLTQGQKQKVQGQVQTKGALKNFRPADTTGLYNQARAAGQNLTASSQAIQINHENGAAINRALRGAPSYAPQRTGYEYAQQNMGHVA